MKEPYLLHIFNSTKNVSPFDVNMAYEAEFDGVIPYTGVTMQEIHALTQDTIFSRARKSVRRSAIFIGGRDLSLALDMLDRARAAMVPPFEVSVFADPSGAITTAAALVALVERSLLGRKVEGGLKDRTVAIVGGTGPVGICCALLAADCCGARVHIVTSRARQAAENVLHEYRDRFVAPIRVAEGPDLPDLLARCQTVFATAKAGVQVLARDLLERAGELHVAIDANAVPPAGIEDVGLEDCGRELEFTPRRAAAFGALAVGAVKFDVHRRIFQRIKQSERPIYADHRLAFEVARARVREG